MHFLDQGGRNVVLALALGREERDLDILRAISLE